MDSYSKHARPPALDRLQDWMGRAIRMPASAQAGIHPTAEEFLTSSPALSAAQRLQIYVDDYWTRCTHALQETFPALDHVLGHEKFHAWMERYLLRFPSRHNNLEELGYKLVDFLQENYEGPDKAFLWDLARFEWAKTQAFGRAMLPSFDPQRLDRSRIERLDRVPLRLQPHLTLLYLSHPVFETIDALRAKNGIVPVPGPGECFRAVYRRDLIVYHKALERPFFLLLKEMEGGLCLSEACEAVTEMLDPAETRMLEKHAYRWFQDSVANGWFVHPETRSNP